MASQVFSGTLSGESAPSSFSYTNTTGQNVRVILNYIEYSIGTSGGTLRINFAGINNILIDNFNASQRNGAFGKNIAYNSDIVGTMQNSVTSLTVDFSAPTEIFLSNSQTFSLIVSNASGSNSSAVYNIAVIPENG